jgi:hypothetical protein
MSRETTQTEIEIKKRRKRSRTDCQRTVGQLQEITHVK